MKMTANEFNQISTMFTEAHNTIILDRKKKSIKDKIKVCKAIIRSKSTRVEKITVLYRTVDQIRFLNDFLFDADIIDSEAFLNESNKLTQWELKMIDLIQEGIL